MEQDTDGAAADGVVTETHTMLTGNVRGLRQVSGEMRRVVSERKPDLIAFTETHLNDDPIQPLIPEGYKKIARLDRTKHGGGLFIGARQHLLVDSVDLKMYNQVEKAEMIGVEMDEELYILCYSPPGYASHLINVAEQIILDNPHKKINFVGNFSIHNKMWICSNSVDKPGRDAQHMFET